MIQKPAKKAPVSQTAPVGERAPAPNRRADRIEIAGGNVAVVCRFRPLNEKEKNTA